MIRVVVLYLLVFNTGTGDLLYQERKQMPMPSETGNPIEDCRIFGINKAYELTAKYQLTYPHASTNVDCQWEDEVK